MPTLHKHVALWDKHAIGQYMLNLYFPRPQK